MDPVSKNGVPVLVPEPTFPGNIAFIYVPQYLLARDLIIFFNILFLIFYFYRNPSIYDTFIKINVYILYLNLLGIFSLFHVK